MQIRREDPHCISKVTLKGGCMAAVQEKPHPVYSELIVIEFPDACEYDPRTFSVSVTAPAGQRPSVTIYLPAFAKHVNIETE